MARSIGMVAGIVFGVVLLALPAQPGVAADYLLEGRPLLPPDFEGKPTYSYGGPSRNQGWRQGPNAGRRGPEPSVSRRSFRAREPERRGWTYHLFDHPVPSFGYFEQHPYTSVWSYDSFPGLSRHLTDPYPYCYPPTYCYPPACGWGYGLSGWGYQPGGWSFWYYDW